jgi:hypothetical protein
MIVHIVVARFSSTFAGNRVPIIFWHRFSHSFPWRCAAKAPRQQIGRHPRFIKELQALRACRD